MNTNPNPTIEAPVEEIPQELEHKLRPLPMDGVAVLGFYLRRCQRTALEKALVTCLMPELMPSPETNLACLRRAMMKMAKQDCPRDHVVSVTPHKEKEVNGYEAHFVEQGFNMNDPHRAFSARVDDSGQLDFTDQFNPAEYSARRGRLLALYLSEKALTPSSAVGAVMVKIAHRLQAVCTRDGGGSYWIPPQSAALWLKICEIFERETGSAANNATTKVTPATMQMVERSIRKEISAELAEIQEQVEKGDMKETALKNRQERLKKIHARSNMYGHICGKILSDLKADIEGVEQLVGQATAQLEEDAFADIL